MPNPKKEFRFESEDWDDFFENDYDYQHVDSDEDPAKKRKNQKLLKKSERSSERTKNKLKQVRNKLNGSLCDKMVPTVAMDDNQVDSFIGHNPPGEFEIGVWKPE